jgi:hypothetical protein
LCMHFTLLHRLAIVCLVTIYRQAPTSHLREPTKAFQFDLGRSLGLVSSGKRSASATRRAGAVNISPHQHSTTMCREYSYWVSPHHQFLAHRTDTLDGELSLSEKLVHFRYREVPGSVPHTNVEAACYTPGVCKVQPPLVAELHNSSMFHMLLNTVIFTTIPSSKLSPQSYDRCTSTPRSPET